MKQENSLLSMECDKNKFEKKIEESENDNEIVECSYDSAESETEIEEQKGMDFSIINDEFIEKFSAPNAPKLIT